MSCICHIDICIYIVQRTTIETPQQGKIKVSNGGAQKKAPQHRIDNKEKSDGSPKGAGETSLERVDVEEEVVV